MSAAHATLDWREVDCVILDMDGTLLDLHFDNQLWRELLPRRYAERAGLSLDSAREQVLTRLAARHGTLPWYCLEHWSETFGVDMHALERELGHLIGARPGAVDFLRFVRARGLPQVLATNAHPASLARKLAATGIGEHFTNVISAHDLGASKEYPEFWQALTAAAPFDPARTLFIDDNAQVRGAARAWGIAHVYGIAQPDSRGPRLCADDARLLESFDELTRAAA